MKRTVHDQASVLRRDVIRLPLWSRAMRIVMAAMVASLCGCVSHVVSEPAEDELASGSVSVQGMQTDELTTQVDLFVHELQWIVEEGFTGEARVRRGGDAVDAARTTSVGSTRREYAPVERTASAGGNQP